MLSGHGLVRRIGMPSDRPARAKRISRPPICVVLTWPTSGRLLLMKGSYEGLGRTPRHWGSRVPTADAPSPPPRPTLAPPGTHQLRRHVTVGRVQEHAFGFFSQRKALRRTVDWRLYVGDELPRSDQFISQRDRLHSQSFGSLHRGVELADLFRGEVN